MCFLPRKTQQHLNVLLTKQEWKIKNVNNICTCYACSPYLKHHNKCIFATYHTKARLFFKIRNKDILDMDKMYKRRMRGPTYKIQEFDQNMTEAPPLYKQTYTTISPYMAIYIDSEQSPSHCCPTLLIYKSNAN